MLTLTVLHASVPLAPPATFTLARALGAQRLIREVAPPARLSSVHDAAAVFALLLDAIKAPVFRLFGIV